MGLCDSPEDFFQKYTEEVIECKPLKAKMRLDSCHKFQESCKTYTYYYDYETATTERVVNPILISCQHCENWISPNIEEIDRSDFIYKLFALARERRKANTIRPLARNSFFPGEA